MSQASNYEVDNYTDYLGQLGDQMAEIYMEMNQKLGEIWEEAKNAFEAEVKELMNDCHEKAQTFEDIQNKNLECQELLRNASCLISQINKY